MGEKIIDISLAILQAAIALAGLLLIFIGFLIGKADGQDLKSKRTRTRRIAAAGLVPFLAALFCGLQSVWAVQGAHCSAVLLLSTFKVVIALTAIYAIIAAAFELLAGDR